MTKSVIFDLDGTLADTSEDLIAAANGCFDRPWLDAIGDKLIAFRGGRAMLRLALERQRGAADEDEVDRLFPRFLDLYAADIDVNTRLYANVPSALEVLGEDGWRLGVCTNKPVELARDLLERLGLLDRFGAILGADSLPVRKPDPLHLTRTIADLGARRDRSLLVGDTDTDRETARNAKVPCVLVAFGPEGRSVERLKPEAILTDYSALPEIAHRLVPQSCD